MKGRSKVGKRSSKVNKGKSGSPRFKLTLDGNPKQPPWQSRDEMMTIATN